MALTGHSRCQELVKGTWLEILGALYCEGEAETLKPPRNISMPRYSPMFIRTTKYYDVQAKENQDFLLLLKEKKNWKLREVKWLFQNDIDIQRAIWCYNQIFVFRNDVASLPLNTRIDGCFFGWAPHEMLAPCLETNGYPDNTVFKQNNHSHFAQMPMLRERRGDRHCLRDQPVSVTHPISHRGTLLLQEMASMPLNYLNSHFLCWMHASVY